MLVLDIDETLIHTFVYSEMVEAIKKSKANAICSEYHSEYPEGFNESAAYDFALQIEKQLDHTFWYEGNIVCPRPYVYELIQSIKSSGINYAFQTTAQTDYAESILMQLDADFFSGSIGLFARENQKQYGRKSDKHIDDVIDYFSLSEYERSNIILIDDIVQMNYAEKQISIKPFKIFPSNIDEMLEDNKLNILSRYINDIPDANMCEWLKEQYAIYMEWLKKSENWVYRENLTRDNDNKVSVTDFYEPLHSVYSVTL